MSDGWQKWWALHYSDVTWVSWRLKSPATGLFVNHLVQANIKGKHQSLASLALCERFHKMTSSHDDVIKWKHFPRNWPFVREIHRSPVNFPHKGQWRGALMFSLMYTCINDWVNNREAGDLRLQHGHYDVIVMRLTSLPVWLFYGFHLTLPLTISFGGFSAP